MCIAYSAHFLYTELTNLKGGQKNEGAQMIKQLSNSKLGGVVLIVLSMMISACEGVAAVAPDPPPCPPSENAYTYQLDSHYINFYNNGIAHINDSGAYNNDREVAFKELVNRIYDWSDTVDINIGGENVRITITYISPEIAQLIVINHYLYQQLTGFTEKLPEQVKIQLAGIIDRNEHIFFITIMAPPSMNGTTLVFPLSELSLTNTSNLTIYREHDDHNLEGPITLKNYPEYGFVYYSMAVMKDGSCQAVFDKNRDTRIVLSVPNLTIAGVQVGFQSWKYKYAPLINMKSITKGKNKFENLSPGQSTPDNTLTTFFGDHGQADFWVWLTRLIWGETILDP